MSFEIPNKITNTNERVIINNYIVIERIGVGSYGRIYKVKKDNQLYVLKEIPLSKNLDNEKLESVKNEAEILSSLNNKYIVKYYESFQIGLNLYIVMEYCEKGDLCTYMSERQKNKKNNYYFHEDFIWKLFIQISIGLYYIHSKKILHRDIKTLNIFLTKELNGKIGDLGVAKVLEGTSHAITFIGTPYYVSPEMCQNKPYNEKSDIWALGCILYELIAFNHPFTASNQAALFIKILHGNYTPLPENTSKDLSDMVRYILQKNYIKRPSMKDIITSKSFTYHAKRLGLESDLNNLFILQKNNTINSSTSSAYKANNNSKYKKPKKFQNQKNEINKSTKIFINEDKINKKYVKKDIGLDKKKNLKDIKNKNIINDLNSIELTPRKNVRIKTKEKKNNNYFHYISNDNKMIDINLNPNSKFSKKLHFSPSLKDKSCSHSPNNKINKSKNALNDSTDLINFSDFINVLEKTRKNNSNKINLNDLFNYQFGVEENKILDTTSATTSLLKLDNALLSLSEMYLIYNSENKEEKNKKNDNYKDKDFCDFDLCDEFTEKEKEKESKRKININVVKKKPQLNYIDKIQQNKKEFRKIGAMKKNELIKNSEICQNEYEKCLLEIKKYSGIINLENLRNSYKNIKNLTDEELNCVFEDMVMKIKKKLPKNKAEKIAEDLYNLIYYENKYELIKRTIKKNK